MWTVPTCSVFTVLRYSGSFSFKGQELVQEGGTQWMVLRSGRFTPEKKSLQNGYNLMLSGPHFHSCLCGRHRKPNPDFVLVRSVP